MEIVRQASQLTSRLQVEPRGDRSVGLVPTMGALHAGHFSLVERARGRADLVVVSIFVNPLQFAPNEDFERYPRDLESDSDALRQRGVDIVFSPSATDLYPSSFSTQVQLPTLSRQLCGASRPGHFEGVATVLTKLFNIVRPDFAFFGQKDAQQLVIVRRLAADLNFPIEIVGCPTVRDTDGLALSSRNALLNPAERRAAVVLFRGLSRAAERFAAGERNASTLVGSVRQVIEAEPLVRVDYVELVDTATLEPLERADRPALLALAAYVGRTRLIDNVVVEP